MKAHVTILLLLLAFALVSCSRTPSGSTIVLIVRHAEKASDAEDSPLTEQGLERARALVRVAEDAGTSAVYSTQFKRNRDTAQPLAARLGIAMTEAPVNLSSPGDYGKVLAKSIVEKHAGQTVVVVGHANTIPAFIEGLTGRSAALNNVEYSDLFIVTITPSGPPKLIKAQYGSRAGS